MATVLYTENYAETQRPRRTAISFSVSSASLRDAFFFLGCGTRRGIQGLSKQHRVWRRRGSPDREGRSFPCTRGFGGGILATEGG